jgi:hypothetical protein
MLTPVLACPNCRLRLEYHVTIEMLDPPVGRIDTGYCTHCRRLFECIRDTGTCYESTLWPPVCRYCRQPVSIATMISGDPGTSGTAREEPTAVFQCRQHPSEQWTWDLAAEIWSRRG